LKADNIQNSIEAWGVMAISERNTFLQQALLIKHESTTLEIFVQHVKAFLLTLLDQECKYLIGLMTFSSISNEIAQRYHTEHQSPQLFVLKNILASKIRHKNIFKLYS
jgi:bacillithiol system protein YtxJ